MTRFDTCLKTVGAACLLAAVPASGQAATWSDTFVGYRYGTEFREPTNTRAVEKHVLQLTHASGYSVGQNFINVDMLQSDKADPASGSTNGATEFYLTYRHQVHLGKLLDKRLAFGPVKEVRSPPGSTSTPRTRALRRASACWWSGRRSSSTSRAFLT